MQALVALLLLVVALCASDRARAAGPLRVVLVNRGSEELSRKLQGEALRAEIEVVWGDPELEGEQDRSIEQERAAAAIVVHSESLVAIYIAPRAGAEGWSRVIPRRPGESDAFALRVVEQLRARLVELQVGSGPAPGAELTNDEERPAEAAAPPPSSRSVKVTSEAAGSTPSSEPALDRRAAVGYWMHAGGAGMLAMNTFGAFGPALHGSLGLRVETEARFGASVLLLLPVVDHRVEGAVLVDLVSPQNRREGTAGVSAQLFAVGADYLLWTTPTAFAVGGIGAGLLKLRLRTEVTDAGPNLVVLDDGWLTPVPYLQLGAGYRLLPWLRVRSTAFAGIALPRPKLHFEANSQAVNSGVSVRWGPLFGGLSLDFDVALPLDSRPRRSPSPR